MKIGLIIPDRGDRPLFLKNCLRMMENQTVKPDIIELVDDAPMNYKCDITWRYRTGYERLRNKGVDVICLIENDDWYSPFYLETMANEWEKNGKPDIFGTNYTIYYHIKLRAYFTMHHTTRASAMNTFIVPNLDFKWCPDEEPYTDIHLWKIAKGLVIKPNKVISVGIKHGEGLCGGNMHKDRLHRYEQHGTKDNDFHYLKQIMDERSFKFYSEYFT